MCHFCTWYQVLYSVQKWRVSGLIKSMTDGHFFREYSRSLIYLSRVQTEIIFTATLVAYAYFITIRRREFHHFGGPRAGTRLHCGGALTAKKKKVPLLSMQLAKYSK